MSFLCYSLLEIMSLKHLLLSFYWGTTKERGWAIYLRMRRNLLLTRYQNLHSTSVKLHTSSEKYRSGIKAVHNVNQYLNM